MEVIHCKDCTYQQKHFQKDGRYKDGGYFIYWCTLNNDPFVGHAVTGYDHEFCSSAKKKS